MRALQFQMRADKNTAQKRYGSYKKPSMTVGCVDVKKGDELNPNYRSLLVAWQMKAYDYSGASFFVPASLRSIQNSA